MSTDKIVIFLFGTKRNQVVIIPPILWGVYALLIVSYLGVSLDRKILWHEHVERRKGKAHIVGDVE